MKPKYDLTGQRFGRLTVLRLYNRRQQPCGKHYYTWWCKCDCGNEKEAPGRSLKNGHVQSCGCLHREVAGCSARTHGGSKTRLYKVWVGIKCRCYEENNPAYKHYGERGVSMCDEWRTDFTAFRDWALSNGYADNLTIERIDNNGNYSPENCCWIPQTEQPKNRRNCHFITYNGETKTLSDWSRELHIARRSLRDKEKQLGDGALAIESVLNSPQHKARLKKQGKVVK